MVIFYFINITFQIIIYLLIIFINLLIKAIRTNINNNKKLKKLKKYFIINLNLSLIIKKVYY